MSGFQSVQDENQQNTAQSDPAPEPACLELSPVDDTRNPWFEVIRNIARAPSRINPAHVTVLMPFRVHSG